MEILCELRYNPLTAVLDLQADWMAHLAQMSTPALRLWVEAFEGMGYESKTAVVNGLQTDSLQT